MEQNKNPSNFKSGVIILFVVGIIVWFCITVNKSNNPTIQQTAKTNKNQKSDTIATKFLPSTNFYRDTINKQPQETNELVEPVLNLEDPKEDGTTLGQKLALIESGESKEANDPYVMRLDNLISQLSKKYNEPKDTIADYTQKTQAVLLKYNDVNISFANLMNEMNKTRKMANTKYKDMISFYAMILGKVKN